MVFREILGTGFWIILIRSLGALLAFVITLVFAKTLGVEDFGIFSLALTIVSILAVIARWGLEQVILKQVSIYKSKSIKKVQGYVFSTNVTILLISFVLITLVWFFSNYIDESLFHKSQLSSVLQYFVWMIAPMSITLIMGEAFKGMGYPVRGSLFQTVIAPLITLFVFLFLWKISVFDIYSAIISYLLGFMCSLVCVFYSWKSLKLDKKIKFIPIPSILKQGWPMLLITSSALIINWSDIIVLGIYSTDTELGIYSVASKIVLGLLLLLVAINSVVAPKYANLFESKDYESLAIVAQISSLVLVILVSVPSIFIIFFADVIMGWFGNEFTSGAPVLIILTVAQLINISSGSVGYLLTMTGNENLMRNIMFFAATVNVLLSIALVNEYGIIGVAFATAVSTILWNVLAMIFVKIKLNFWVFSPGVLFKVNFAKR